MNLTWHPVQNTYAPTHKVLKAGRWSVGAVHWDSVKQDDRRYIWTCRLPGLLPRSTDIADPARQRFATEQEAMDALARIAKNWFAKAVS